MNVQTSPQYGNVVLPCGRKFNWTISNPDKPEVWGCIHNPDGTVVKGSAGWYRTSDPELASQIASRNFPKD